MLTYADSGPAHLTVRGRPHTTAPTWSSSQTGAVRTDWSHTRCSRAGPLMAMWRVGILLCVGMSGPSSPPANPQAHLQPLIFMALDILEDDHGQFTIWGASASGASVLLQVQGFRPYLYVVAPAAMPGSAPALDWFEDRGLRESFRAVVNRAIPPDLRVAAVLACDRRPLQYCRPADLGPAASPMLRLEFDPGTSLRRAAPVLARCLASPGLLEAGWNFGAGTMFESEIGLLQRFLADMPVSGEGGELVGGPGCRARSSWCLGGRSPGQL